MAKELLGKPVTEKLNESIKRDIFALKLKRVTPTLAVIRVGEMPSDVSYEKSALKRCEELGVACKKIALKALCTTDEVINVIKKVNADPDIHGCLLFRPLPGHLDIEKIQNALDPAKDVDCMTDTSIGAVFTGKDVGFAPCTPRACMELLDYYDYDLKGKNVVVVGRSAVVGKPLAMLCLKQNATVTICHTKTVDMPEITKKADILIVAAGKAGLIDSRYVSKGQVVIDVGTNVDDNGKLRGDVDYDSVKNIVDAITPVPGGVGGITTSVLVKHVTEAAKAAKR